MFEIKSLKNITDAIQIARSLITDWQKEHCIGIYCNSNQDVIHIERITIGLVDSTLIHPREIFKPAIINSATHLILLHNHPSNNVAPSRTDRVIMKSLDKASDIMGIDIYDQIIFSKSDTYFSHKENKKIVPNTL